MRFSKECKDWGDGGYQDGGYQDGLQKQPTS